MLGDLLLNIGASIIYDFGKAINSQMAKNETVQTVLKQLGASPSLHDFPERYVEALVEFRFMDKNKIVLDFFREESIAGTFYAFYYGDASKKGKESALWSGIEHFVESLKVGDDVKAHDIDVETEVKAFWAVFKQKVSQSKTVKEVEVEQTLDSLKNKVNDIHEMLVLFQNLMKQQGKTDIQIADKIYNIDKIETAFFGQLLNKPRRFLTQKPFKTDFFIGRDADLAAIETDYLQKNHLLVLVNGEGGMGKTTLAAQYWREHEDRYKHLAWLFADGGVGNALLSLAANLGITFSPHDDEKAQIARITEGVNNLNAPCLFVFDNANKADDLEKHFGTLRRLSNCHVLLTSRVTALADVPVHRVLPLNEDFAVQVFTKYYPKYATEEAGSGNFESSPNFSPHTPNLLHNLLHAVGYNTLVIELLAKNLAVFNKFQTQYSLQSLVTDLQERGLFAVQGKTVETLYQADSLRKETPDNIITAMYDVSALSDTERFLLNNFAVLPAENIPYIVFMQLLKPDVADVYDAPLSSLQQKGWIDFYETSNDFKISPVIQHITKRKNAATLLNDCAKLIQTLKNELHPDKIHDNNYKMSTVFARYAETVVAVFETPQYNAALLCERIGTYYTTVGNLDRAIAFYEKCRIISKELCVLQPQNEYNKNELAVSYSKLGETHTSLGNLDKALGFYENDIKLSKELYADYPNNVSFKNGLAISYEKLGDTHSSLGNLDKALGFFEDYNRLEKELYADYPNNVSFKNSLAISYSKLGDTHSSLGNLDKALGFFKEYNRLERELYADYPNNVSFKNGLAISYEKLGVTHSSLGNLDKALGFFEERSKLGKELYADYPNNVDFKNGLAISYSKLGDTHSSLGNLDKALGFFEERNKLGKELYADYPNNVDFKNGLAVSYSKLGWFYKNQLKNRIKARYYFEKYLALREELAKDFPSYAEFQRGLQLAKNALKSLD